LENTEHLRNWLNDKVESIFYGNLSAFAEKTTVSRQTWMNILGKKYNSLRQQAVDDLCSLFSLSEIDLYIIAHPETATEKNVKDPAATYKTKDEAERLADYIRKAPEADREFIFNAAERCGFKHYHK